MNRQLPALVEDNAHKFVEKGNRAFREMMADFSFESFTRQYDAKLKQGYRLHYLGVIKRLGMDEYLWRISITDYQYEPFGSITLAKEFVVGFKLE
ncbi:MAG: hypothetical protein KKD73_04285 [Proteobacteria bacterium]|nr:hypothetical protein [Pseudomonadota bacterium]MBU1639661.1 hypothetical protein [Pseudomonadota bacterium]